MDEVDHAEEETSAALIYDSDSAGSTLYNRSTSSILRDFDSDLFDFGSEPDQPDFGVPTNLDGCEDPQEDAGVPTRVNQQHHEFEREISPPGSAHFPSSPFSPLREVSVIRSYRTRQHSMPYAIPNQEIRRARRRNQ